MNSNDVYAKLLDSKKIKYVREPKNFELDWTTYRPDFYLPKTNIYIEVVGTLTAWRSAKGSRIRTAESRFSPLT